MTMWDTNIESLSEGYTELCSNFATTLEIQNYLKTKNLQEYLNNKYVFVF